MIIRVFGPPGTGKTSYLMTELEKLIGTYEPEEIAVVSFSRAAVKTARSRVAMRFGIAEKRLCWFRTLHSLCFAMLGVSRDMMLSGKSEENKELANLLGWPPAVFSIGVDDDPDPDLLQYLLVKQSYDLSRTTLAPVEEIASRLDVNVDAVRSYGSILERFMDERHMMDFTRLLEFYIQYSDPLPVKVMMIDEAQDLSPLQWKAARKMAENCDRLYVAGDDDQAIYGWAGAMVEPFLELEADDVVLGQSYRVPRSHAKIANSVVQGIRGSRKDKLWKPRDFEGTIEHRVLTEELARGADAILCRTNATKRRVQDQMITSGYLFRPLPSSVAGRLNYDLLGVGKEPYMSRRMKSFYQRIRARYPTNELRDMVMEDRGTVVETIHSVKGMEWKHVVLLDRLPRYVGSEDDERRVWYVGLTRALERLTLVRLGNWSLIHTYS